MFLVSMIYQVPYKSCSCHAWVCVRVQRKEKGGRERGRERDERREGGKERGKEGGRECVNVCIKATEARSEPEAGRGCLRRLSSIEISHFMPVCVIFLPPSLPISL